MLSKLSLSPRLTSATNHPPLPVGFRFWRWTHVMYCIFWDGGRQPDRPQHSGSTPRVHIVWESLFNPLWSPTLGGQKTTQRGSAPLPTPHCVIARRMGDK